MIGRMTSMEEDGLELRAPVGLTVRPARPGDAAAVARLVAASQRELHGEASVSRASVLRKWQAPYFDLERDAWLVEADDGRAAAFAAVRQTTPGRAFEGNFTVHPAFWGRGIGAHVLERMVEHVRAAVDASGGKAAVLRTWCSSADPAQGALYMAAGFERVAVFSRMEKDLEAELQPPEWAPGIEPRVFRRGTDDRAVYTVLAEAFGEAADDLPGAEEWSRDVVEDPRADPSLWLLAWEGDTAVGAALCSAVGAAGVIERLAVRPARQGRGIGGALLREAFALLRAHGATEVGVAVQLGVAVEALDLYRRAGMAEVRHVEFFEKRIEARA